MNIIPEDELRNSPIVANCRMNRKRKLIGVNSYEKELKIDIEAYLLNRKRETGETVRWLDICCGEGNALIEFGHKLNENGQSEGIELVGIDLIDMFNSYPRDTITNLNLISSPLEAWEPSLSFDLITCIHGLHYLGDKLKMIQKIGLLLKPQGLFYGNLSLKNMLDETGKSLGKSLKEDWQKLGWVYQSRQKLLIMKDKKHWMYNWEYLGADDQAGPNYTGQEVVNSYYKILQ